ncbi:MAG: nicotinate phosphoribosyltransferase [Chloroflexota bacterium]
MTVLDGKRLTNETFRLDIEGIRRGYYSDKYFANVQTILRGLRDNGYVFEGDSPRDLPSDPAGLDIGNIEVEAQLFNRREPRALVAGTDVALAMIRHCAGHYEDDTFIEAWQELDVTALQDGMFTEYSGDPSRVQSVIEIRGRYSEFSLLETPMLGVLTRASRLATNVYQVLEAAGGKPVLFFPARFDLPSVQELDGYAYWVAVQRYNQDSGKDVHPLTSADAQSAWWGGRGGGTVPHAIIACFLADTAESMRAFARLMPVGVPRIALVDFNNDTVRDSLATIDAYWPEYRRALEAGDEDGQKRWQLNGVRLDTSHSVRDKALGPDDPKGVNPKLVHLVREALNNAWTRWDVPAHLEDAAREYCRAVQIVASGGFNRERISRFEAEKVPVDSYGVGSTLLENNSGSKTDYTMDVVRVNYRGEWLEMAKVGRKPGTHPQLSRVDLSAL